MDLAWISIAALVLRGRTVSCTTAINVGVLSLALAWLVGVYLGGMSVDAVLEGFPTPLLVTLVGVTLLFSIAECNGTLARVTGAGGAAVPRPRGPPADHVLRARPRRSRPSAPAARRRARCWRRRRWRWPPRAGIPPLLMAIMAGNGALAGTLSPFRADRHRRASV